MIAGLDEAVVSYGPRRVLGPFSLSVDAGDTVALVGPSGCGKSTAMRLLAGLEPPMSGSVVRNLDRGQTALVFQAPTLMPWASSLNNVALPLRLTGLSAAEARERAHTALDRVGLPHAENLKPAQLSGGMAMRVALARALAPDPSLLLLDEPFAALDEITRRTLADDLLQLWTETRPAMVFVTHNVEEAVYMCRRIVVMTPGPGTHAGEVLAPPASPSDRGRRRSPEFRDAVEQVSALLAQAMEKAA